MQRVLLVDDEPALLSSLTPFLTGAGFHVLAAGNADDALRLLRTNEVDSIVCDLRMPGLNGFEFHGVVRKNADWQSIPFVFLTGASDEPGLRQRQHGCRFLIKPFDPDELVAILSNAQPGGLPA
jgi:DNA-binding response OmpR family regulator